MKLPPGGQRQKKDVKTPFFRISFYAHAVNGVATSPVLPHGVHVPKRARAALAGKMKYASSASLKHLNACAPHQHFTMTLHFVLLAAAVVLICALAHVAQQPAHYSRSDRTAFILAILRQHDFAGTETCCERTGSSTVYIVDKDLNADRLPRRKYVRFALITEAQAHKMAEKEGVESYTFDDFVVHKDRVRIGMEWTYARYGPYSASADCYFRFTGWKKGKSWIVKGIRMGCSAS